MDIELLKKELEKYRWNITTLSYDRTQKVAVQKGCNGYVATNVGDTPVTVNGQILFPSATPATVLGDSISVGGNLGEIYGAQQIDVVFASPAGAAPLVTIVQKFYIAFDF